MARAVAEFDWSQTPLGPTEKWPIALRVAVDMMLNSLFPKCIVWGDELITIHNDAFKVILGEKPEALGRSFAWVWAEAWEDIGPIAQKAFGGEATFIEDFPLKVYRNGYEELAYFTFCYSPIVDQTGKVAGIIDTVIETTKTVEARQQLAMSNAELVHRMKNLIGMVASLVRSTLNNSSTVEAAQSAISARMIAMSSAQDILLRDHDGDASVRDIVENALLPYIDDQSRILIEGPELHLARRQAQALTLALHELQTNATKYGALSTNHGSIIISWRVDNGKFSFQWIERGGPVVVVPSRRGFGSSLIERLVAQEFSGLALLAFPSEGAEYTITASTDRLVTD